MLTHGKQQSVNTSHRPTYSSSPYQSVSLTRPIMTYSVKPPILPSHFLISLPAQLTRPIDRKRAFTIDVPQTAIVRVDGSKHHDVHSLFSSPLTTSVDSLSLSPFTHLYACVEAVRTISAGVRVIIYVLLHIQSPSLPPLPPSLFQTRIWNPRANGCEQTRCSRECSPITFTCARFGFRCLISGFWIGYDVCGGG
jgi:hypothetical protein